MEHSQQLLVVEVGTKVVETCFGLEELVVGTLAVADAFVGFMVLVDGTVEH